jgi:excisionase family DNA binding protein
MSHIAKSVDTDTDNTMIAVDAHEAARRLSVSATTIYNLIAAGELPSRRIGKKHLIHVHDLEDLIRNRPRESRPIIRV